MLVIRDFRSPALKQRLFILHYRSGFQITRKSIQHEEKEEIKILGQDKENDQSKEETIQGSTSFLSSEENTPVPLSSDNATRNQGLDNNGDFPEGRCTNAIPYNIFSPITILDLILIEYNV